MSLQEFEEMQKVAELNTLWYTPWWERVDWGMFGSIFLIIIVTATVTYYLSKDRNYYKIWQGFGRFLIGMIVLAETITQVVKPFPKMLRENLVRDRVIR